MSELEFISRVQRKIQELAVKQRELQVEIHDLEQERGRYAAALAVWGKEMGSEAHIQAQTSPDGIPEELAGRKIPEAIEILLEADPSHQMFTTDIVTRLRMAGVTKAKGTGAYSSAFKTLGRRSDLFYEVEKGKWGLVKYRDSVPALPGGG